jgi:hypothetical protein
VTGHVLGNYAKAETDGLADMLGAIAARPIGSRKATMPAS